MWGKPTRKKFGYRPIGRAKYFIVPPIVLCTTYTSLGASMFPLNCGRAEEIMCQGWIGNRAFSRWDDALKGPTECFFAIMKGQRAASGPLVCLLY